MIQTSRHGYGLIFFLSGNFLLPTKFNRCLLASFSVLSTVWETDNPRTRPWLCTLVSRDKTSPVIYARCHFSVIQKLLIGREQSLPDSNANGPSRRMGDRLLGAKWGWGGGGVGRQVGVPLGFTGSGESHLKVLPKWVSYLFTSRQPSQLLMVRKWIKCKWRDGGGSAHPKLYGQWIKVL